LSDGWRKILTAVEDFILPNILVAETVTIFFWER
jgi:hypothetical protein